MPTDVVSDNRIGCFFCFATHRLLIQRIGCSFLQNGGITTFNTHRLNVCYMPPMPSGWLGGIRTQSLGFLTDIGITQESARIPKHRIINLVLTLQRNAIFIESPVRRILMPDFQDIPSLNHRQVSDSAYVSEMVRRHLSTGGIANISIFQSPRMRWIHRRNIGTSNYIPT